MEDLILSPRDPDQWTHPADVTHSMFGKNIAAADMAIEPPEGFVSTGPKSNEARTSQTKEFAAGGSSVGSSPPPVPPRTRCRAAPDTVRRQCFSGPPPRPWCSAPVASVCSIDTVCR